MGLQGTFWHKFGADSLFWYLLLQLLAQVWWSVQEEDTCMSYEEEDTCCACFGTSLVPKPISCLVAFLTVKFSCFAMPGLLLLLFLLLLLLSALSLYIYNITSL